MRLTVSEGRVSVVGIGSVLGGTGSVVCHVRVAPTAYRPNGGICFPAAVVCRGVGTLKILAVCADLNVMGSVLRP
jgi:hypothetical protein